MIVSAVIWTGSDAPGTRAKRGDVIAVRSQSWKWGKKENVPPFSVREIDLGAKVKTVNQARDILMSPGAGGEKRECRVTLSGLPAGTINGEAKIRRKSDSGWRLSKVSAAAL